MPLLRFLGGRAQGKGSQKSKLEAHGYGRTTLGKLAQNAPWSPTPRTGQHASQRAFAPGSERTVPVTFTWAPQAGEYVSSCTTTNATNGHATVSDRLARLPEGACHGLGKLRLRDMYMGAPGR